MRHSTVAASAGRSPQPELVEDPATPDGVARFARVRLEQLALLLRELAWHLDVDEDIDREARGRLKHLQEGTQAWDIEYSKVVEQIRRSRGLI
jgi:hypothetical protein